jgi:hypothetical protein
LVLALAGLVAFSELSGVAHQTLAQPQPQPQPEPPARAPRTKAPPKPKTPDVIPDEAPKKPVAPAAPAAPGTKPATTPNTKPAAGPARELPRVGPYLERENAKSWVLKVFIRLNSDRPDATEQAPGTSTNGKQALIPKITPFKASKIAVVFPGIESSASSECRLKNIEGVLKLDDQVVDDAPTVMESGLYHSGVKLIRVETPDASPPLERTVREVAIDYTIPVACFSTKYDATNAEKVPWPSGAWPVEAASTLTPQLFIDMGVGEHGVAAPYPEEETKLVQGLIEQALLFAHTRDPKAVPPAKLAKILTRQIWQDIQISGTGKVARARTGELTGFDLQTPARTIQMKRGDQHDVTALTAAVFRKAGLPTRTVIGLDMYAKDNAAFLKEGKASREPRSWVEFALYDEAKNTINWIPVDIPRLRRSTSRPKDLNQPWMYFGTHDELNSMLPFAFHFHPPTDVVAYTAPGFWGWYVEPTAPGHALQALRFDATSAANKGGGDDKPAKDNKKDPKDKGRY